MIPKHLSRSLKRMCASMKMCYFERRYSPGYRHMIWLGKTKLMCEKGLFAHHHRELWNLQNLAMIYWVCHNGKHGIHQRVSILSGNFPVEWATCTIRISYWYFGFYWQMLSAPVLQPPTPSPSSYLLSQRTHFTKWKTADNDVSCRIPFYDTRLW